MTNTTGQERALKEVLETAADAYEAFVTARNAMNAARPAIDATPAERALYDERYKADHAAEREHFSTAIQLAHVARPILAALPHQPATDEGDYEARYVHGGAPADCVDYGVIRKSAGKEVCRVWHREDAEMIARLLNASPMTNPPSPASDTMLREALEAILQKEDRTHRYQHAGEGGRSYTCDAVETLLNDIRAALTQPELAQQGGDGAKRREDAAWEWLDKFAGNEHPNDREYSADQMVDAFIAGIEHSPLSSQQAAGEAEAVAELLAKAIYGEWERESGFVPWVERGNSMMQEEARRKAWKLLEANPLATPQPTETQRIVAWMGGEDAKRIAVTRICDQQRSLDSMEALKAGCSCMAAGGIGFGKLPAALLCRDTYEEMWGSIAPKLIEALSRGEHLAGDKA